MIKQVIAIGGVVFFTACTHQNQQTNTAGKCPPVRSCASPEEVQEMMMVKQRNQEEFEAVKAKLEKATAFQERWLDSFTKINRMIKVALAPEAAAEATDGAVDGNVEDVIKYQVEFIDGAMHISFSNDQMFKKAKAELTPMGNDIVGLITGVLAQTEERKITIGSRTTMNNEELTHNEWLKVRDLSGKRAVAIMDLFEQNSLAPRLLSAVSLSTQEQENPLEQGTTVIIIHPTAREMPKYPDAIK